MEIYNCNTGCKVRYPRPGWMHWPSVTRAAFVGMSPEAYMARLKKCFAHWFPNLQRCCLVRRRDILRSTGVRRYRNMDRAEMCPITAFDFDLLVELKDATLWQFAYNGFRLRIERTHPFNPESKPRTIHHYQASLDGRTFAVAYFYEQRHTLHGEREANHAVAIANIVQLTNEFLSGTPQGDRRWRL